jgi:type IV secretion system protein VirB11
MRKKRYCLYLSRPLAHQLERVASLRHGSKSALLEEALRKSLEPEQVPGVEEGLVRRLNELHRAVSAIARDQTVLNETTALFVRYMLAVTPPLPDSDQEPARLTGRNASTCSSPRSASASPETVSTRPRCSGPCRSTSRICSPLHPAAAHQGASSISSPSAPTAGRPNRRRAAAMPELFAHAAAEVAEGRRRQMLRTAFGPAIAAALADPTVIEVMANPDGKLWIESVPAGRRDSGRRLGAAEAERIIRLVAAHVRREVTATAPIVSAELPETGERFEGVMPPVATAPCFSIRKPAQVLCRLADYVAARIMTPPQAQLLRQAVTDRRNIVVVGGTSSGKTTLVNALLAEVASLGERVLILEDTRELQCAAQDVVALRTKPGVASLADLVRSTLRLRPDRIIVGEVRGPEALDMLKAWNTGHPGGLTTVHANSGRGALLRLEQLVQEAVVTVPRALIAEAIDLIVFLAGRGTSRRVESLIEVQGVDAGGDYLLKPLAPPVLHVV